MTTLKIALALVLTMVPGLAHAATLRTAPFPGADIGSGYVRCAITNGSNKESDNAVTTVFNRLGIPILTDGPVVLPPGETFAGNIIFLDRQSPTWCLCELPNKQHMCSFIYVNGATVEVIRGE